MNSDPSAETPPDPAQDRQIKPRKGWRPLRLLLAFTRALILDQRLRRTTMFYVVIADMLMVFVGATFLDDWLDARRHLTRFLVYWLVAGWLTVLAALLAVYDLLLLRLQHRLLQREMRKRMLDQETSHEDP